MIGRRAILGVAALGLMALSPENQPPAFTVTAEQGYYDGWESSTQGYVGLKARVTVLELGPYGRWSPGITGAVEDKHRSVSLQAYSYAEGYPIEVSAMLAIDEEEAGVTFFQTILDPARPFDIELRWTSDGLVCLSVRQADRGESLMFPLGGSPSNMGLYGSGGSFQFSAIEQIALPAGQDRASVDAGLKTGCVPIS